jgi:carbon-monoxide dehydrogenase medium subunit
MKAPNFRYAKPRSLEDAFAVLQRHGDAALPLAGGQSLLATLNMRLSAPDLLVDIGGLDDLRGISAADGVVRIGALTRHCEVLESPIVARRLPLVAEAVRHVGHVAIRNRGTLGGSLAYADPAAELPACMVAHGATIVLGSAAGRRELRAADFFTGLMETALAPGELILEVRVPEQRPGQVSAFAELSRRHGDFALVGLAALATVAADRVTEANLVYIGCTDRARLATRVSETVVGWPLPPADGAALARAVEQDVTPMDTPGCKASTRLQLAKVLTGRVLRSLQERAQR